MKTAIILASITVALFAGIYYLPQASHQNPHWGTTETGTVTYSSQGRLVVEQHTGANLLINVNVDCADYPLGAIIHYQTMSDFSQIRLLNSQCTILPTT